MGDVRDKLMFLLRISPLTIYQLALGGAIFTKKRVFILFMLGVVGTELMNHGLKSIIRQPRPSGKGLVNSVVTGCSSIPEYGKVSDSYGMPSGHAQLWGYTAAFWALYMIQKEKPHAIAHGLLLFLAAMLVAWSRVDMLCHSVPQVVVGLALGAVTGFLQVRWLRQD